MRTKIAKRSLPRYTAAEERLNTVSHALGVILGMFVLVLLLAKAYKHQDKLIAVSGAIYGLSFIALYLFSSLYHGLPAGQSKKIMQIFDHCVIYIFIAATYTPVALNALIKHNFGLGVSILVLEWSLAILLVILTAYDLKKFRILSMIGYLVMGWAIIGVVKPALAAIAAPGFYLLLAGGVAYTLGTLFYGLGRKVNYMHALFHLFVLLGSLLHFAAIYLYVI